MSRYFASPAFPAGSGPDYVNVVAAVTSRLTPRHMLDALHRIEAMFDRAREKRWAARTLDLDLLACEQMLLPDRATVQHWIDLPPEAQSKEAPDQVILPHPRLQDRAFVLVPLVEIDANWRHPILNRSVQQFHDALPASLRAEIVPL